MPTVCRDQDDVADWLDRAVLESKGAGTSLLKQFACIRIRRATGRARESADLECAGGGEPVEL
jgi:hypothetical protein